MIYELLQKPAIHLEFASVVSLIFIFGVFLGFVSWLTYMQVAQRRLMKSIAEMRGQMLTKKYLDEELEKFKREIKKGIS